MSILPGRLFLSREFKRAAGFLGIHLELQCTHVYIYLNVKTEKTSLEYARIRRGS